MNRVIHKHLKCRYNSNLLRNKPFSTSSFLNQISPQSLEQQAEALIDSKPDFQKFYQYQSLIDSLESTNYFKGSPSWLIYKTKYQPFIKPLLVPNYIQRTEKLHSAIDFIEDNHSEELHKLLYSDLVDTIMLAVETDDSEEIKYLLDYLYKVYGAPFMEDYHTFLYWAIERNNGGLIHELINGKYKLENVSLADFESELIDISLAQLNNPHSLFLSWDSKRELNSFNISLIVEALYKDLGFKASYSFVDYLSGSLVGPLSIKDFDFMVQEMKDLIVKESTTRKKFQTQENDNNRRPKKVFIQRVDINTVFKELDICELDISDETKSLFINTFLKAVSELSNTSGVVYAYTLINLDFLNKDSWNILFHSCSRGSDSVLRMFELFQFAISSSNKLSKISFTYLINHSVDHNEDALLYYLHHYFLIYDNLPDLVTIKLKKSIESTKDNIENRFINDILNNQDLSQKEIVEKTINSLNIPSFVENFKPTIKQDQKSKFDILDSQALQRHHSD